MTAPEKLDATQAAAAIRAGKLTATRLVEACAARIGAREGDVGAWTHLDLDAALRAAREADKAGDGGLLHGVPIGIKDIIDTHDMPTGYGARIYSGHRPPWDAACVTLARRAGAIVLGKTVTTEFAYFHPGKTKNPHDTKRTPGGSSSGSAAGVADGHVPLAFGSQTAASITRPASFCGVIGYKPTTGSFSLVGVKALSPHFDTLGFIARSVADIALMRAVQLGQTALPALPAPPTRPRLALCRTPWWSSADAGTQLALDRAVAALTKAGAQVTELELPTWFVELVDTHKLIMGFEAMSALGFEHKHHRGAISPQIVDLVESGLKISRADYDAAIAKAARARAELAPRLGVYDGVLAPSAVGEAPLGLGATGDPIFSRMWTLLHVPSLTLPAFTGPQGLPVGVQLVGRHGEDARLIALAARLHDILRDGA